MVWSFTLVFCPHFVFLLAPVPVLAVALGIMFLSVYIAKNNLRKCSQIWHGRTFRVKGIALDCDDVLSQSSFM